MLKIKYIIDGIENLDKESFECLFQIAHPRSKQCDKVWEKFADCKTYIEKEIVLSQDKKLLHYVEAYCVGIQHSNR